LKPSAGVRWWLSSMRDEYIERRRAAVKASGHGLGLIRRFARCFSDWRDPRYVEHSVKTLVGRRVFRLALGYEDRCWAGDRGTPAPIRCWSSSTGNMPSGCRQGLGARAKFGRALLFCCKRIQWIASKDKTARRYVVPSCGIRTPPLGEGALFHAPSM
jgi:hypothetical protein